MKTKKKKPETKRRFGSFWVCPNCQDNPEFEHEKMMTHLKDVHGVGEDVRGKRRMLMHLDGDTWYSWQYEWEINGLKFVQSTCHKRTGENAEMWG